MLKFILSLKVAMIPCKQNIKSLSDKVNIMDVVHNLENIMEKLRTQLNTKDKSKVHWTKIIRKFIDDM